MTYRNRKLAEENIILEKRSLNTTPAKSDKEIKRPPILFRETQKTLEILEQRLNRPVFSYWGSYRGSVSDNDVLALYEILKDQGPISKAALFIKSDGGSTVSSLMMVNMLREYISDLIALIPLNCASAATIIALGANELHMGPLSYLTAIDSSLRHNLSPIDEIHNERVSVSLNELDRIVGLWKKHAQPHHGNPYSDIFNYIHPLVIGAIDRSSSLSVKICQEVLSYHMQDVDLREQISGSLNADYPSHSYPITFREAKKIGLNVMPLDFETNEILLQLNNMYSEMARSAVTDHDESHYHDNSILNFIERKGMQVLFQFDKDMVYMKEERRWVTMNYEDSWKKLEFAEDGTSIKETILHIS